MKKDTPFQDIGKETPYQVPSGFFEQISEKTLLKARQREQSRKRKLTLWRTMAVAASLVAFAFIGYLKFDIERPETKLIVQERYVETPIAIQKQEILEPPVVSEKPAIAPEKEIPKVNEDEDISNILSDLTDEELLQLAAIVKTDPFMEVAQQ
jgi:hypothetical protein